MAKTNPDMKVDSVRLGLSGGQYRINIVGIRDKEKPESVKRFSEDSFDEALKSLSNYSLSCYGVSEKNGSNRFISEYERGGGSESGTWVPYWMVKWSLSLECSLTSTQEGLIHNLVQMHNHQVSTMQKLEDIAKSVPA